MALSMGQINFCAKQCEMQQVGPRSVYDMCFALEHAQGEMKWINTPITTGFVKRLGQYIEPTKNNHGFRTTPVYFNGDPTRQAIPAYQVERAVHNLITYGQELNAEEAYYEFQKIHPFKDGNGRVGAILYNIWLGTIGHPTQPPNMFQFETPIEELV